MDPQSADRLALACIHWARRPGPTARAAIDALAGDASGLSREDRLDICSRLGAADALTEEELEGRLVALGGKALVGQRKSPGYLTTSPRLETKVAGRGRLLDDRRYETPDGDVWLRGGMGEQAWQVLLATGRPPTDPEAYGGYQPDRGGWAEGVSEAPDPGLLASAIQAGKAAIAAGYGAPQPDVCRLCATTAPDETYSGRCRHWVAPAERQRRDAYARDPQRLVEAAVQAERSGVSGYTPVVTVEHKIAVGAALANRGLQQR
jgi:hypothetical protein